MKKTFRMRRVLTLSLASMMMLGGFQAAPFGGVKVVKAQQDARLEAIKADFENFLNRNNAFYTIESPNANDTISGRVKITITDSNNYEYNGNIEYIWLSLEEDTTNISSGTGDEDQKRKDYFTSSNDGRKKQPWSPDSSGLSIEFSDEDVEKERGFIYLKHEKIDKIFARGFDREVKPVQGKKDNGEGNFWIEDTVEGAKIHARENNTIEIKKVTTQGTQAWKAVPMNTPINLLDGVNAGESAIWRVRTKTAGKKLPSLPVEIAVKKKEALTLEHLRALTFTLEGSNSLKVSGFGEVFKDYRIGNIKYKVGDSEAVEISSSQRSDLTISNVVKKTVKFYVGDSEDQNFSIVVNQAEKPNEQTVKKKDEKTITFGDGFQLFRYKKVGENEYKTPDKAEVTNLVSGTYEVIKAGSDTKTHKFNIVNLGASHTLTFDSEPLKIKLEAPSLPPYLYFPELEDLSASEEKKTEEKKEEEKKETEKKVEEEKKEAEKKPETEQTESVVDEKKAESNTKIEKNTEAPAIVNKSVRSREKTVLSASVDMVKEVLKADKGNLNLIVKGGSIKLSHATLEAIFGFEAEKVSLNMKVSELKKKPANLTNRLASKKVYDVRVKVGKETINDYDLQGNKFLVSLDVKLAKAKKYFVLNVKTGERIPAKYRKGKLDFKTSEAGQFVIVK